MEKKTVLVTGIGGNVGQGIIRNIHSYDPSIRVVGTNVTSFSAGNHLCDTVYKIPYAYHKDYIKTVQEIVVKENIALIIPATDYEGYYLAKYQNKITTQIVISSYSTMAIYLDKYTTYLHHKENAISFAKSYLPSEYQGVFEQYIAKPREGRGSRGLLINPPQWNHLSDKEYMIQEYHEGKEITIAFYVTKEKKLHGFITFERSLENGATQECVVRRDLDHLIHPLLHQVIAASEIVGSANIQAIIDKNDQIHIFEINCRVSGTNSIRHNFGFRDVVYALQEYLYETPLETPKITEGKAVRILMDIIYPETSEEGYTINSKHFMY